MIAGHAADLWGVVLITVGILAALAFYADSLDPAGHDARLGVGDLLGWGRFLVPPVAIAVGILLLINRGDEEAGEGRSAREPARAVIGASLTLLSVAGLAALAGGSPSLGASTADLSSAGGWIGAVIANPLRVLHSAASAPPQCWWPSWWWPWCCSPACRSTLPPGASPAR